jgi:hypothetical protein
MVLHAFLALQGHFNLLHHTCWVPAQRAQLVPLPLLQVSRLVLEPTLAALARERSLVHHQLQLAVRIAAQGHISLLQVTY